MSESTGRDTICIIQSKEDILEQEKDPLFSTKKNLLVNQNNEFIIRVFALVKCKGLLNLTKDNQVIKQAPEESYHLCIFENLVDRIPNEHFYRSITSEDLLKKGKLNKWVLSDVDGVMRGNSFVRQSK